MNRKKKAPKKYLLCLYVDYIIKEITNKNLNFSHGGENKEIIFVPPQHPPPPSTHSLTHPNNILSNMLKLEQLLLTTIHNQW